MESQQHSLFCPICKSSALSANKQSFNNTNALIGNALLGTSGLKYGLIGTGKIKITCLACGYEFKPGEGATEADFDEKHNMAIQNRENIKGSRHALRYLILIVLILIIAAIWTAYNVH